MPGVGKKAGRNLGAAMASAARRAAKVGMVAVGAAAGASLVAGFKSAIDQQKAEATLKGLYGSAKEAGRVMSDLRTVASKSSIDYSSYTKTAETLAYMGVSAKDAGPMLENMGKMIVGAGGSSADLERAGDAMLKMVNSGKVYAADLNQLSQTGIPVISGLATKFFGDASAESIASTRKMVSAGKVAVEDVQEVIQKGTGKNAKMQMAAADEVEKSLSATWKRTKDNVITSIGALLVPIVEKLTPMLAKAGNAVARFIDGMASGKGAGGAFAAVLKTVGSVIGGVFRVLGKVVKVAWNMKDVIGVLVGGWLAYKAALIATNAAGWASYLWQSRSVILGATRIAITKAMTAAQRGLNASMRANPIGLVITALTLLVAGFVLAYKRSETFRRIVNAAWSGIKTAVTVAWNWIKPILAAIGRWIGKRLPGVFSFLWKAVKLYFWPIRMLIKTAWAIIKPILKALWAFISNVLGPIFKWLWRSVIRPAWNRIKSAISSAWTGVIRPAFNAIKKGVHAVGTAFSKAKDFIGRAWNKIRRLAAKPINFVIGVINKLGSGINKILPGDPIPKISKVPGYATGGPALGPGTGTSDSFLARLSNNEHVLTAKEVAAMGGHKAVEMMRAMARKGMFHVPGFAKGGRAYPLKGSKSWTSYAGHTGLDFPRPMGTPVYAVARGRVISTPRLNYSYGHHVRQAVPGGQAIYAHLSRIAVKAGQMLGLGARVGNVGSTGNSTGPHLHFEIQPGGELGTKAWLAGAPGSPGKGGSGPSLPGWLSSAKGFMGRIGKLMGGLKDGGIFGVKALTGFVKDIGSKLWDSIKGKLTEFADAGTMGLGKKVTMWTAKGLGKLMGSHDAGGVLGHGNLALNLSGKPEAVLTQRQWDIASSAIRRQTSAGPAFTRQDMYDTFLMALNDAQVDLSAETRASLERGYVAGIDRMDRLTERRTRKEAVACCPS